MLRPVLLAASAAAALAGCTHLETSKDYGSGSLDTAVTGIPYALPEVQFDLEIAHSVQSCPATHRLSVGDEQLEFSDGRLQIATAVESAPNYVAGEQYLADYRALSSFVKTTGYGLETYPSGILKSLNASAEDHSADLIKDVVSIGLSIAKMSTGGAAAMPFFGPGDSAEALSEGDGAFAWANAVEDSHSPELEASIRSLKRQAKSITYLACRSMIESEKGKLAAKVELLKAGVGALAEANARVARLTLISASDHANHGDLDKLEKALADQATLDAGVAALLKQVENGTKALSVIDDPVLRIGAKAEEVKPSDTTVFERLLVVKHGTVISAEDFATWWLASSSAVRGEFRTAFPTVAEAYGVEESDPAADRLSEDPPIGCASASVRDCVMPLVTIHATLTPTGRTMAPPASARLVQSSTSTSPGLFIRSQQKADYRLCVGHADVATCPARKLLLHDREIAAPQLGQLRFLPFSSRMFESAKLSLALRENGSIEKFEYGVTKSMSSGSAAIRDAVDQYSKFRDEREAKAKTNLQEQRVEQLAEIEHRIALKTKEQALAKLVEPATPNPLAEISAQTAAIEAEIALLEAQLTRKTAEAALLGSNGP